ncbi:MAG: serine hydrolase domain-containing protein [Acidimicrobiales bacterium]
MTAATLHQQAVDALDAYVSEQIDTGAAGAAQYAIAAGGEVLATRTFGAATPEHRFVIFSATKTIVAMAILPHLADGSLELTRRVADYLPEFGTHGKDEVTVLQLLTMQGGFPQAPMGPKSWGTSAGRRAQFAEWTLSWKPGAHTEYHPIAAHWVIAELLESLTGRPYAEVVHERVTARVGVPAILAAEVDGPVVEVRARGSHPGTSPEALAALAQVFGRPDLVPAISIGVEALLSINDPRAQSACIPGGGGRARAADVALTYQGFLADDSTWGRDAIGNVRNASLNIGDNTSASRTITGVVAGHDGYADLRWFPATAPRAFGHHGAGGQLCWLDPDTGMSFCYLHDTLEQHPGVELTRIRRINELAHACVRR